MGFPKGWNGLDVLNGLSYSVMSHMVITDPALHQDILKIVEKYTVPRRPI